MVPHLSNQVSTQMHLHAALGEVSTQGVSTQADLGLVEGFLLAVSRSKI
jgi:hypothetical protein